MDKDTQEYIDSRPELQAIYNRASKLTELGAEIEAEADQGEKLFKLELFKDLSQSYSRRLLEFFSKETKENTTAWEKTLTDSISNTEEYKRLCEAAADKLQEERELNNNFYNGICLAIIENPKETFTEILRQVERKQKTECQDGIENLSWTLKLTLMARLRLAWKLIF
jgi:hypothetical protein